jgi:hypothetical protein
MTLPTPHRPGSGRHPADAGGTPLTRVSRRGCAGACPMAGTVEYQINLAPGPATRGKTRPHHQPPRRRRGCG